MEICTACSLCYTGQTGGHIRCTEMFQEATVTFLGPGTKTTSVSQLEGKQERPQNLANQLETFQELTKSTTTQSYTRPAIHPQQIAQGPGTGQTSHTHRSYWSGLWSLRWTARCGSTPPNNLPDLLIRFTDSHKTFHNYDLVHQNLLNQEESNDFHQEHNFPET
jgi:hypothetical protein